MSKESEIKRLQLLIICNWLIYRKKETTPIERTLLYIQSKMMINQIQIIRAIPRYPKGGLATIGYKRPEVIIRINEK